MLNKNHLLMTISSGFTAVLLGAFGAHALKSIVPAELMETWKTASFYHFIHTVVLLILITKQSVLMINEKAYQRIVNGFLTGILLFSGSLYLYVISQIKLLAMITPLGGFILLLSWAYWFKSEWIREHSKIHH